MNSKVHPLDIIWRDMKKNENIIIHKFPKGIETIQSIDGKQFFMKCKAKDTTKLKKQDDIFK